MATVPERLKKFPTWRGMPIHYTLAVNPDGSPAFKEVNDLKRVKCFRDNLCHLCGESLARGPYWLIGGPMCVESKRFVDGPMHYECALYACHTCPFLSSPDWIKRIAVMDELEDGTLIEKDTVIENVRPHKIALCCCTAYKWAVNSKADGRKYNGGPLAANPFREGQLVCLPCDIAKCFWDVMPQYRSEADSEWDALREEIL